ncbi:MAG: hypothetical protein MUF28_08475 [Ignavibacterium sp.]|jgi:hypothetical protein|nr:hypothetical protein [Ignavibacterium sp.]
MIRALISFIISFTSLLLAQGENIVLVANPDYPLWLKTSLSRTQQTSGIAFIKSDCDEKYFLTADDIGFINLLTIKNDTIYNIDTISFTDDASQYLDSFPKKDFEEIVLDPNAGEVYLSIEGNGQNFNDHVGIYKLIFENDDIFSKQIIAIEKLNFKPEEEFYKYTNWNTGYEGVALDNNYFYLGLEGFVNNYQFADSSLIYIVNKSHLNIIKTINTKSLGIHTICGLFSDEDYSLWGIDRNNRTIFHILFDEKFNIKDFSKFESVKSIPGYHNLNYLPSFESITMDEDNNLYIVDDPWKEVFVPAQNILDQLNDETVKNFKNYIPIIFKYNITNP